MIIDTDNLGGLTTIFVLTPSHPPIWKFLQIGKLENAYSSLLCHDWKVQYWFLSVGVVRIKQSPHVSQSQDVSWYADEGDNLIAAFSEHFIRSMHIVYLRNFNTQVVLLLDGFICLDRLLAGVVANGKRENIVSCVWTLWWNQSWTDSDISVKVRIGWYIFHMGELYILGIPDIFNLFHTATTWGKEILLLKVC